MSKQQLIYIHGGKTFKSRRDYLHFLKNRKIDLERVDNWSGNYLTKRLERDFQLIRINMPLKENARYLDWKINFENYLPHLKNNITLVGYSLGGIFLAKYLAENKFPKKIRKVILVAPPFDNSLSHKDLVGGFSLPSDLSKMKENCSNLHLLFSQTDEVVPLSQASKYYRKLLWAKFIIFPDKGGHFWVKTFPEIIKLIKDK